jgi:prephenate dehydrogenase
MIDKLVVVGVGLIGGSLALALRQAGQVRQVVGVGRSRANLDQALALGVIDEASDDPAQALAGADVVLLALPVAAMADWFGRIAPHLGPGTLITDAGSTKQDVIAAARTALGSKIGQFVPGHPIAGAERSGVGAARADLFQGKNLILTPLPENAPDLQARAEALWQSAGTQVLEMAAAEHDRVFAAVSHLPHLAAFALVDELASRPEAGLFFRHAGSGFRDFTRIAASSPEMWRDVALANRQALSAELDAYLARLSAYRAALNAGDADTLMQSFTRASAARSRWQPAGNNIENDE